MIKDVFNCDRCKQPVEGAHDAHFTAGYYNVGSQDGAWRQFGREGEERICDHCMWSDPAYQAIYGRSDASVIAHLESL